ncbi:MAG TPA: DUF5615 family PIN-like protein [Candidatus Nanoarchaeia archaeon]|nr:DUF5615 family PIN-like protein [Candidatus Nanoarchaeia archaeon]
MKLFLDENLPLSFVESLQKLGFLVEHVRTAGLQGADDQQIALYAKSQKLILITKDVEFGSLLLYPSGSHYGLVVLRLPDNFKKEQIFTALTNFLAPGKNLAGFITIVEIGKYRVRKLP